MLDKYAKMNKQNKPWEGENMFSSFEKDKEIFSASASMETGDGLATSAIISGILATRKNKDEVKTPKKYKRQLALAEKFEAMTSEERQAYLERLEKKIAKQSKIADYFDNSHKEASDEGKEVVMDALKTGANLGVCTAVLGMCDASTQSMLSASMLYGVGGAMVGIYSQLAENEIKDYISHKKLNKLVEEWTACSIAENTSEMEM